jgi:hypothetical protein
MTWTNNKRHDEFKKELIEFHPLFRSIAVTNFLSHNCPNPNYCDDDDEKKMYENRWNASYSFSWVYYFIIF